MPTSAWFRLFNAARPSGGIWMKLLPSCTSPKLTLPKFKAIFVFHCAAEELMNEFLSVAVSEPSRNMPVTHHTARPIIKNIVNRTNIHGRTGDGCRCATAAVATMTGGQTIDRGGAGGVLATGEGRIKPAKVPVDDDAAFIFLVLLWKSEAVGVPQPQPRVHCYSDFFSFSSST